MWPFKACAHESAYMSKKGHRIRKISKRGLSQTKRKLKARLS